MFNSVKKKILDLERNKQVIYVLRSEVDLLANRKEFESHSEHEYTNTHWQMPILFKETVPKHCGGLDLEGLIKCHGIILQKMDHVLNFWFAIVSEIN